MRKNLVLFLVCILCLFGCSAKKKTMRDVIGEDSKWISQGGIYNPFDTYSFDFDRMLFIREFKNSYFEKTETFKMEYINDSVIKVDGIREGYEYTATLSFLHDSEDTIRIDFTEGKYMNELYFLNRLE